MKKQVTGARTAAYTKPQKARVKFRQYSLSFKEDGKVKNERFKFLKEARQEGLEAYRKNCFIGLYNHNGIPLTL